MNGVPSPCLTEHPFFLRLHRVFTVPPRLSDFYYCYLFGRFSMLLLLTFAVAHGNLSPAQRLEICQEHGLLIRNRCTWRRSKDLTVTVSYLVTRFLGFRLRVSGDKGMSLSV